MSSYSHPTKCEKCGYEGATKREESYYTVYYCPLCGWQDFFGDDDSYNANEGRKYNPTEDDIARAKRYIKYLEISELDFSIVYDYDLISYRGNEFKFMKELLEIVFNIGE